jgi:hypothetical protein
VCGAAISVKIGDAQWEMRKTRGWAIKARQPDILAINEFIQERLRIEKLDLVTAVEANRWLEQAGLLSDDKSRPGKSLRNLLRQRLIAGAWQDPPKKHGRWFIGKVSLSEGGAARRLSEKGGRPPEVDCRQA